MKFAEDILSAVSRNECQKISDLARGKVVLELGSHFGRSTVALASTAAKIHAIDWHLGDGHAGHSDSAPIFIANLTKHGVRDKVVVHVGRFEDILQLFKEKIFDFCFIDAFHTKEAVLKDANAVFPLMKAGAVIAFHDYGHPAFGVTEGVKEFAQSKAARVSAVVDSVAVVQLP